MDLVLIGTVVSPDRAEVVFPDRVEVVEVQAASVEGVLLRVQRGQVALALQEAQVAPNVAVETKPRQS